VKRGIDIVLETIHVGEERRVVTLSINDDDPAMRFLIQLKKKDRNQYESISTRIRTVAKYERYENKITFRHVGGGVYEFKRPGVRLYAFYDDLEGEEQLILCTNGGKKDKRQQADIDKAKEIRARYFDAKQQPDTTLYLKELNE